MIFSLLFQEGPAETTAYMIAGYAVIFVVMAIYIGSLWLRWRNLHRDQEMLEKLLPSQPNETESWEERNP
jgi:hypothetical protein